MSGISDKVIKARKPKSKFPVLKEIGQRFSPRYFSPEHVSDKDINSIFEAARLTPSGRNSQPWYFYWTRSGSTAFDKLYSALSDINKWAGTASILIVCTYIDKNEHGENEFELYDLGASVYSLILQATNLGYYARQMGIFDREKASVIIKAPQDQKPFIVIALGRIGDYSKAPEELIKKDLSPSSRKEDVAKEI